MTPFGKRLREIRDARGITLTGMAHALDVSPAYLSALEHGKRSRPTDALIDKLATLLNPGELEALRHLARLSHPRVTIVTAGMSADATALANLLAQRISSLPDRVVERMLAELSEAA